MRRTKAERMKNEKQNKKTKRIKPFEEEET